MTDIEALYQVVDNLSPEELKKLYLYIVENHVQFLGSEIPKPQKRGRILGLYADVGETWMSDDFNAELPDEFWMGEE